MTQIIIVHTICKLDVKLIIKEIVFKSYWLIYQKKIMTLGLKLESLNDIKLLKY